MAIDVNRETARFKIRDLRNERTQAIEEFAKKRDSVGAGWAIPGAAILGLAGAIGGAMLLTRNSAPASGGSGMPFIPSGAELADTVKSVVGLFAGGAIFGSIGYEGGHAFGRSINGDEIAAIDQQRDKAVGKIDAEIKEWTPLANPG